MAAIFTACWFATLPPDYIKVGISRGTPRGMPAGYKKFGALNPGSWFNSVEPDEYLRLYNSEILAPLDPAETVAKILKIAGDRKPALCCYESAPKIQTGEQWCHRHIVAVWLEDNLGEPVPEVDFPELDRFAKLRLAGVAAPSFRASADLLKSLT